MSAAAAGLTRSYNLHGVGLEVTAQDGAVHDAVDLRLRAFAPQPDQARDVSLRYERSAVPPAEPLPGRGRPVYDTPYGSLRYCDEFGALVGLVGGVSLECDPVAGSATFTAREFAGLDLYLATHPLATVALMELLEHRGLFSLHAACLTAGGAGVLLAGPTGSGKSTLALALARAGWGFLSDDVVFLGPPDGRSRVRAFAFPDALGLTAHALEAFPELLAGVREPPAEGFPKALGRIEDWLPGPSASSCSPVAIVFPTVAPSEPTELAPLEPGQALIRLAPDVLLTDPTSSQDHLEAIGALLGQVRCCTLRCGADLGRAVELIGEALGDQKL